jgi:anti-sigma factor RsiW
MTEQEYRISLGAYVLGALEPDETTAVELHLQTCAACQLEYLEFAQTLGVLSSVSPEITEAGLAGRSAGRRPGGPARDDLARRRNARAAGRGRRRRGLAALATAAAVLGAVAIGAVVAANRPGSDRPGQALESSIGPPVLRTVSGANAATGVAAVVTLRTEPGGTRLEAQVTGRLMAGWQCHLVAVPRAGGRGWSAGSRRVTAPSDGIRLDGPVALALDGISRVEIQRADGQVLVSLPL